MRKILIDTDTCSDDAMAIVMALRDPDVKVLAITTVAGGVDVDRATDNAKISVEKAGTYTPPIYKGAARSLFRARYSTEFAHGEDGMGGHFYPVPNIPTQSKHGVNAIIDTIRDNDDVEIVAIAPLTNIALAIIKAPEILKRTKMITFMGSAGMEFGNTTPMAEANIYTDAEACKVVLESGIPITVVGWDACIGDMILSKADMEDIENLGSDAARFCIECNSSLRRMNTEKTGEDYVSPADQSAMAAAIFPECVEKTLPAYTSVETKSEETYGEVVIDHVGIMGEPFNATFVTGINADKFKGYVRKTLK